MTDEERRMLDVAGQHWNYAGTQAATIRSEFGITITRFWQRINQLCDDPAALAYAPSTVYRLRRVRASSRAHPTRHV